MSRISPGRVLLPLFCLILTALALVLILRGDSAPGAGSGGTDPRGPQGPLNPAAPAAPVGSGPAAESPGEPAGAAGRLSDPERETAPTERDETETRLLSVSGTVGDRAGRPLPGIQISIFRPGFRGVGGTVVAHQLSDREGRFSLLVPRGQALVVEATSEEYQMTRVRMRPGGGPAHDLVLESLETTELLGRLLDPEGRPLTARNLYRLFPELDPLEDGFLTSDQSADRTAAGSLSGPVFDQLSRLVFFSSHGPGRSGGQQGVEIDAATARFRARIDGRFEGQLALIFRGREIERRSWRSGDPEVRLTVDVEALFEALGEIEVEVLDDESGAALGRAEVEVIREQRLPGRTSDTERMGSGSLRPLALEGVPAGRYLVVARASGYSGTSRSIELEPGGSVRLRLRLVRPAAVRILLRFPEAVELTADQLDFSYLDRNNAEHPIEVVGQDLGTRLAARVTSVPVGPGAFLFDDSVLRVDLVPGENPDLDWELRPVRDYRLEVQLFPSPYTGLERWVDGWLEQFDPGGLRIGGRRLQRLKVGPDGFVILEGSTAVGRQTLRIDFGDLRRIDTRIKVDPGTPNNFRFPLR